MTVGPRSWSSALVRLDESAASAATPVGVSVDSGRVSGGGTRVETASTGLGTVTRDGVVVLDRLGLHLRHDDTDTWTMFADRFDGPVVATLDGLAWTVEEDGPLRGRVRGDGRLGDSRLALTVSVDYTGRVRLDIDVTMVELFRALQLVAELPSEPLSRLDGIPAGAIAREPGNVEWPVQGWSLVRRAGSDVALVTADAYSLSLDDRRWQWTLLRTPQMAWPPHESERRAQARHTDQGEHRFSFELMASPALAAAAVARAARQQARPPFAFTRYEGLARPPWGPVPPAKLRPAV
jgi:alpha-mannosidase